jgi:hypothetical protein
MDIKRSTLYYQAKSNKKIKEADINSKPNHKIYPNLIKDKMVTSINQIWCADITYCSRKDSLFY